MICGEVRRMLGAYVDKELELTRQPDLEKHLAGCSSCQAAAEDIIHFSFTNLDEYSRLQSPWRS
jgi:anti-sigma factor RsiW